MDRLAAEETLYLKSLSKNPLPYDPSKEAIISYLSELGYVTVSFHWETDSTCEIPAKCVDDFVSITESGRSYLRHMAVEDRHWRIPVILSVIALILSAASIVLSPFFQILFSRLYGLQQ